MQFPSRNDRSQQRHTALWWHRQESMRHPPPQYDRSRSQPSRHREPPASGVREPTGQRQVLRTTRDAVSVRLPWSQIGSGIRTGMNTDAFLVPSIRKVIEPAVPHGAIVISRTLNIRMIKFRTMFHCKRVILNVKCEFEPMSKIGVINDMFTLPVCAKRLYRRHLIKSNYVQFYFGKDQSSTGHQCIHEVQTHLQLSRNPLRSVDSLTIKLHFTDEKRG